MFNISLMLGQLFNGFILGAIYALLSMGLSIIFGMMNVVNFAHGILYVMGAYLSYVILSSIGNFWVGLSVIPIIIGLIAILIEVFLLRPLREYDAPVLYSILLTFGVSLVLRELLIIIFGPVGKPVTPPPLLRGFIDLGITFFPLYRLAVFIIAGLIIFSLWFFIERTKYGSIIRAGTEDSEMVSCLGINIPRLFTLTFALGAVVAAISGGLIAPMRGVEPFMGDMMQGISFAVVIIGGLGSISGAIIAGFIVGLAQSLTVLVMPSMSTVIIFVIMAIILLLKPQGLFGVQR